MSRIMSRAFERMGTVAVSEEGESLRLETVEPDSLPVFGGVFETLLPGEFCFGDLVFYDLLNSDGVSRPLAPDEFRLLGLRLSTDGATVEYGRPYLLGRSLPEGQMVRYRQKLRFAELADGEVRRQMTVETLDAFGDSRRCLALELTRDDLILSDLLRGETLVASRRR